MGAALAVALPIAGLLANVFMGRPRRPVEVRPQPPPPPPSPPQAGPAPPPKDEVPRPEVLIERARRELGVDCINCYNFAVSGQSGVGKSSFINGIRSISGHNHPDWARVGQTECTQVVKSYPHPRAPHLVLWDLPGAGTKSHPAATYFSDKMLYAFDAILILTSDRFMEVDLEIAKAALQYGKPCAFVRTKCDIAVRNTATKCGTAIEASKRLREDVENSFRSCLRQAGLADSANRIPLFLISSEAFTKKSAYRVTIEPIDDDDDAPPKWDKSLPSMDENKLLKFLMDSARPRAKNKSLPFMAESNLLKSLMDYSAKNPA